MIMAREDLKEQMQGNFLQYASYVILDRAIPDVSDGLKPVQRRILYTLHMMDNGRFHKVANVVGQTMALHPHGDAAINDALVHLAQKNFLLDQQGNFGNPLTGDPAAAARYIETRLSPLARETLFNDLLTQFVDSYDGRAREPVALPSKLPLLLMQGVEGIAVGMSTRVFPHNPIELWRAQIALLDGKPFELVPDFPSGGVIDTTHYQDGRGKLMMRAKVEVADDKTIVIREICPGTTTDSVIKSIDDAAKRGRIKIDSINDYTAENVHIEIKLPRGQHAEDLIPALYAFTECQVVLHGHCMVIKEGLPWDTTTREILSHNTENLQKFLRMELTLERERLLEEIFQRTLERIFIEEKIYKGLEGARSEQAIDKVVIDGLKPFHHELLRVPHEQDRKRLCAIPIRRISQFDAERTAKEIAAREGRIEVIEADLRRIPAVATQFLKSLIAKYGSSFPRKTQLATIEAVDKQELAATAITVGYDPKAGFLGTGVKGSVRINCTSKDKLLLLKEGGSYEIIPVPEKIYCGESVIHVGVADRSTQFVCIYSNVEGMFAKRFIIDKFILSKTYSYLDAGDKLERLFIGEAVPKVCTLNLVPMPRLRNTQLQVELEHVRLKGVGAKGIRLTNKRVQSIE